jgi:hypothetical protein
MSYGPNYISYPSYQPNKILISNRSRLANYNDIYNTSVNDDIVTYQTAAEDEDYISNNNSSRTMTVIPSNQLHPYNTIYQPRQIQTVLPQAVNYANYSQPVLASQPIITQESQPTSYIQQIPVGLNQSNIVYQSHPQFQQRTTLPNNLPIIHYTNSYTQGRMPAQIINYPADPVPAAPAYYPSTLQNNVVFQRRSNAPFFQYQYK